MLHFWCRIAYTHAMQQDDFIGTAEVAKILGRNTRFVQRLVAADKLKPFMRGPGSNHGTFLFKREDVEAYKAAQLERAS